MSMPLVANKQGGNPDQAPQQADSTAKKPLPPLKRENVPILTKDSPEVFKKALEAHVAKPEVAAKGSTGAYSKKLGNPPPGKQRKPPAKKDSGRRRKKLPRKMPAVALPPIVSPEYVKVPIEKVDLGKMDDAEDKHETWHTHTGSESQAESKPEDSAGQTATDGGGDTTDTGDTADTGDTGGDTDTAAGGEGGDEEKTHEEEEEEKAEGKPGDWGADPSFRKALEILAFSKERREDDIKEGKKKDTSKARVVGAGPTGRIEYSQKTRSGKTRTESKATAEGMAGVRAAAKTMLVADDQELTAAFLAIAQAGAFGSAGMSFDARRGKAAISLGTQVSGGIGSTTTVAATAHVDLNRLVPAMCAVFEFATQFGVSASIRSDVVASYGNLEFKAFSSLSAFAGVAAELKGAAFFDWIEGVGVSGQVGAKAGAEAKAAIGASVAFKGVGEFEVEAGVMAFAGGEVKAKGKVAISLTGVEVEGRAAAFAGVKVTSYGKAAFKMRGREVVKVSGKIGVAAGAGAEVGGKFTFIKGKLVIEGELAAVLKGGATGGVGLEVDFPALAAGIGQIVADQWNKEKFEIDEKGLDYRREAIADKEEAATKQRAGHDAVVAGFEDYAVDVISKIRKDKIKGTEVLDQAEIQKLIQEVAPRLDLRYRETDRGIEEAAQEAFGELLVRKDGKPAIMVDGGVVRFVVSKSPAEAKELSERYTTLKKVHSANNALTKELRDYATLKLAKGKHGVKKSEVQKIIDKNWDDILTAFPADEAPHAVINAVIDTMGGYLGGDEEGDVYFSIDAKGQIIQFGKDEQDLAKRAKEQKEGFATSQRLERAKGPINEIGADLRAYKAKLVGNEEEKFVSDQVRAIVAKHVADIPADAPKRQVAAALEGTIQSALDPIVTTVQVSDEYGVTGIAYEPDQVAALRAKKVDTAKGAVLDRYERKLRAKRDTLLKKGVEPAKFMEEMVKAAVDPTKAAVKGLAKADDTDRKSLVANAYADDLAGPATSALAPLCEVQIGRLGTLELKPGTQVADKAVFNEELRKVHAKIKGGSDEDNARRALVANAMRKAFGDYGNEMRAALQAEIAAKDKGAKLPKKRPAALDEKEVQKLINEETAKITDDVKNQVGDEAVVDAAARAFGLEGRDMPGPYLLKQFAVSDLKITTFVATPLRDLAGKSEAQRNEVEGEKRAQARLTQRFKDYAERTNAFRPKVWKEDVQAIIDLWRGEDFPSVPDEFPTGPKTGGQTHDLARMDAVITAAAPALGELVKDFRVDDGVITRFVPVPEQDTPTAAREKLRKELEQYAATAGDDPKKDAVDSCLQAYRNNVAGRVQFVGASGHDRILADLVLAAFGGKGTVTVFNGELTRFEIGAKKKGKKKSK